MTGDIAEVLIFDGPLSASARQKVESYLAIKYGITLNNSGGQLGSIVGNSTYDYITADGAVFWQASHPYIYDIAGIGVDRFQDNAYPEDLRYHQDQRISKSSNPGARVTISTGPDFTSDALEFAARPSIDGDGSSYEHNYLVWANDHGSINLTNTEIPPSISDRIGREWKVQITSSAAVSISNVSVRINLSGSDILTTCGIRLLIDTDGDGDFTTGTISEVLPTTIDGGGNAFFDGINFQHNDVFTVGYVDDIPPTASNPSPVTVCDTPPAPDPNIVTDEADNCGSATVTHLNDVSDGNTNPETITRTYRVSDGLNNVDVVQTISVYTTPDIDALLDIEACDSFTFPAITGTNLTGNEAYYTLPNGGGTQYNPGDNIAISGTYYIYDETGSSPNCSDQESFVLTITSQPDAGTSANMTICEGDTVTAADLFAQLGGSPDGGGTWSPAPAAAGIYTYTVSATLPCTTDATATVTVTEQAQPDAGTSANMTICEGDTVTAADLFAQLGGSPDGGGTWSPAPAAAGIYTYTVSATLPCTTDATATVTVTEQAQPDAGTSANMTICEGDTVTAADLFAQLGGSPDGGGTWSPAPAAAGIYTYTVSATLPCTTDATATVTVTEQAQPDAGTSANMTICEGDTVTAADLFAQLGGSPDGGGTWSPAPAAAGIYTYTVSATLPCTTDATATVTVTEQAQPDAGTSANMTICEGDTVTAADLFAQLGGSPDGGGTWSPAPAAAGIYTYTVSATLPCTTDATATVTVDINEFNIQTTVENETCLGAADGIIHITIESGTAPYLVNLNSSGDVLYQGNQISINGLASGSHNLQIRDNNGCEIDEAFEIQVNSPNLNAEIKSVYNCDSGLSGYSVEAVLEDTQLTSEVLYALDSTNPQNHAQSPYFTNVGSGNHFISIIHESGCSQIIPFEVAAIDPIRVKLSQTSLNQITANATGGVPPYTYFFENSPGSYENVFEIPSKGHFTVRVVDSNGCEDTDDISIVDFVDLDLPNFFTPNGDGQNDTWGIKNAHEIDPEILKRIKILVYDRNGRSIEILEPLEMWDGRYSQTNKDVPSGDYWYLVSLNGKKEVGHVTLYR